MVTGGQFSVGSLGQGFLCLHAWRFFRTHLVLIAVFFGTKPSESSCRSSSTNSKCLVVVGSHLDSSLPQPSVQSEPSPEHAGFLQRERLLSAMLFWLLDTTHWLLLPINVSACTYAPPSGCIINILQQSGAIRLIISPHPWAATICIWHQQLGVGFSVNPLCALTTGITMKETSLVFYALFISQ